MGGLVVNHYSDKITDDIMHHLAVISNQSSLKRRSVISQWNSSDWTLTTHQDTVIGQSSTFLC